MLVTGLEQSDMQTQGALCSRELSLLCLEPGAAPARITHTGLELGSWLTWSSEQGCRALLDKPTLGTLT